MNNHTDEPVRRGGAFANFVAVLALVIALGALFYAVFRDPFGSAYSMRNPFGSPLSRYDLASASGAFKSQLQMRYNTDVQAEIELQKRFNPEFKEQIDTLEIKREADFKRTALGPPGQSGKPIEIKLLFTTYKRKGETQYKVESMEKHEESGMWRPSYIDPQEIERTDKTLAQEYRDWQMQGSKK
jgi:hypothetical protein